MKEQIDTLTNARQAIDALDEQIVALINQRAELARLIGQTKASCGMRVYAPDRERQVFDRVSALSKGPVSDRSIRAIYREMMSASLALERTPRVAILGPEGSFSHLAGTRKFGFSVDFQNFSSITAVFDAAQRGQAELALVPVENSSIGGVGETLDALVERDVLVVGELKIAIHHHLLGNVPLADVERVYSKAEIFDQCRNWLTATGLIGRTVAMPSSSAAAQQARDEAGSAAIGCELAGELFGLSRIAEYVEDDPTNVTRFLILGASPVPPTGADKTSLVFSVSDRPGALVAALDALREGGINMTRLESRPNREARWANYFFVDIEGHLEEPEIAAALQRTQERCSFWKVLGSYPGNDEVL